MANCATHVSSKHAIVDLKLRYADLVGGFNPSEKYESQFGMIIFNIWKHISHVPNHQPVMIVHDIS